MVTGARRISPVPTSSRSPQRTSARRARPRPGLRHSGRLAPFTEGAPRPLRGHGACQVQATSVPGIARDDRPGISPRPVDGDSDFRTNSRSPTDGRVDAHAQRVRPADDLKPALLRELLDEDAVFREQARVMDADGVLEPLAHSRPVGAAEPEALDLLAMRFFSSRVQTLMLVKSCALCAASAWVKWTTYTGALPSATNFSSVCASRISE